jgi:pentatricopeptide repeat-containing protein PET309
MLERTAGCLETGSLRRLLPGSKKSLKSRRMLHSTFWNHGAGELELSPVWTALIRGHEVTVDNQDEKTSKHNSPNASGLFLDFLYPSGAVKLVRQCSSWGSERQETRRLRPGARRFEHRLYTSLAQDARKLSIVPDSDTKSEKSQVVVTGVDTEAALDQSSLAESPQQSLEELLGTQRSNDYEEAWRQYKLRDSNQQIQIAPQLLKYLSKSSREIDSIRTLSIFNIITTSTDADAATDAEIYQAILNSSLQVGNVAQAIEMHKEIVTRFEVPLGSDTLLAFLIDHASWELAFEAWGRFQGRNKERTFQYNVWGVLDKSESLQQKAVELAEYEKKNNLMRIKTTGTDMSRFVSQVIVRALIPKSKKAHFQSSSFLFLLDTLNRLEADTPQIYDRAIEELVEQNRPKLAMECYRQYRQRTSRSVSRSVLHAVLNISCRNHSDIDIQQVLEDWYRFYGKPSRRAIRLCIREFASRGDVTTVKSLFSQHFPELKERRGLADDIAPLLHVHAKRGDLTEVIAIFDNMEATYGTKPNLRCFNILLNSYCRAHDFDGAFSRFETMVDDGLKPDHYTFGTLMAMCVTRGDLPEIMELYQMAESQGVQRSVPMIDCIVLGHLQDGHLTQAERICEDALTMKLDPPLTRMWNYLLTTYAMRRDLENVNRILNRMKKAEIVYDGLTYSALMQALSMIKQPDRAYDILKNVMPEAGLKATAFHYAVVMGGFLATNQINMVFQVYQRMLKNGVGNTVSTRLMAIKASAIQDQQMAANYETELSTAYSLFYEAFTRSDYQEFIDNNKKGVGREAVDVSFSSIYYDFLIFVYGQRGAFHRVKELYQQYKGNSLDNRKELIPRKILNALITSDFNEGNHEAVQQCWDMAFLHAKIRGKPIRARENASETKVLPLHALALSKPLQVYMRSLAIQKKSLQLEQTIKDVQAAGFELDNKNWNTYIQLLTRSYRHKLAFELCEEKLIGGWTGWARIRWQEPRRNRLPLKVRYWKRDQRSLRPIFHTFLHLARAMLDLEDAAIYSRTAWLVLKDLEKSCPRTIHAIRTMQRMDSELEREILQY